MASRVLSVRIIGDAADLERAFKGAENQTEKTGKKFLSLGKAAALGAGAAGVGLVVAGLKSSVDAARESEKAQARLENALKSAGVAQGKYGDKIDASIQKTSRLAALDDEDLSDAFSKLVATTGDVTKATDGMNLAADIARARNISLEAATKLVEKAYLGSDQAFKKVGVTVPKVTSHFEAAKAKVEALKEAHDGKLSPALKYSADQMLKEAQQADKMAGAHDALAKATERFGGSAEKYGKTSAAAQERFQIALENVQETIGSKLLPVLAVFFEKLSQGLVWVDANWPRFQRAVQDGYTKVKPIFDALRGILDGFVQELRGFINIIAGVFSGDWSRVWQGMKQVVSGAFDALLAYVRLEWEVFKLALRTLGEKALEGLKAGVVGLAGVMVNALEAAPAKIVGLYAEFYRVAFNLAGRVLVGLGDGLLGIPGKVASAFASAPGSITAAGGALYAAAARVGGRVVDGVVDGVANLGARFYHAVASGVNWVVTKLNGIIGRINSALEFSTPSLKIAGKTVVPGISFDAPDIPSIPALASGGVALSPTLAMIGEAGPEAIVPLDRAGGMLGGDLYATFVLEVDGRELARTNRKYALRDAASLAPSTVTGTGAYGLA